MEGELTALRTPDGRFDDLSGRPYPACDLALPRCDGEPAHRGLRRTVPVLRRESLKKGNWHA